MADVRFPATGPSGRIHAECESITLECALSAREARKSHCGRADLTSCEAA
jgi:hypothetical protein